MKPDLCFVSSIFCCLQRLLSRWQVSHGLSLGISDSRLKGKPKPAMFSQMDGLVLVMMPLCRHGSECLAAGLQEHGCSSEGQWSLGRHNWHV